MAEQSVTNVAEAGAKVVAVLDESQKAIAKACSKIVWKELIMVIVMLVFFGFLVYLVFYGNSRQEFQPNLKQVSNSAQDYRQLDIMPPEPEQEMGTPIIEDGMDFISHKHYYAPWGNMINLENPEQGDPVDTSTAVNGLNNNRCSMSCCSKQWPLPFKLLTDDEDVKGHVPNNYFCNNGLQDSGCVCMTQDQSNFLDSRGANKML
jgi:hypothetical protein